MKILLPQLSALSGGGASLVSEFRSVPRAPEVTPRERVEAVGLAPPPRPVAPSAWALPDASTADADGVVGIGADLTPETLVDAYRRGMFPWPHPGTPLPWCSPDPRGVVRPDDVRVSRSLAQRMRRCGWLATVDRAFDRVVEHCASARADEATWILPEMVRAYRRLHEIGWAHSVEIWDGDALVGGLYGVQIGSIFTGESMFHLQPDASKIALVELMDRFAHAGGRYVDVQIATPHLVSLGASEYPRSMFVSDLEEAAIDDVRLRRDAMPVARLVAWRR
ncbi:MAG: leucyl/phenylalanyl-tRNA--protein transferase [Nitriliruptoraceae bacterium]